MDTVHTAHASHTTLASELTLPGQQAPVWIRAVSKAWQLVVTHGCRGYTHMHTDATDALGASSKGTISAAIHHRLEHIRKARAVGGSIMDTFRVPVWCRRLRPAQPLFSSSEQP